jgi:methylenetetrahydrofolate reductase (NADPH)
MDEATLAAHALSRESLDERLDARVAGPVAELVANGSIELAARDRQHVAAGADQLPMAMSAYVTALPNQSLETTLECVRALHRAGLDPVPHIAARRVPSRAALRAFLDTAVRDYGVHRVLLVAGDVSESSGPFTDTLAVLRDDILAASGIREIGIAGYPEGHPRIAAGALQSAFRQKLALAQAAGLGLYVVTQFSFAPARVIEYCAALARSAPEVAVYVGVAGPTDPAALLRYAQRCGVSASLRALRALGIGAVRLVSHTDPLDQLRVIAHYASSRERCNIVGAHVFSFGGFARTAQWMNRVLGGAA